MIVVGRKVRGADKSRTGLEAVTADQSGGLQGGCRVPASDFSAFAFPFYPNFNKLFFIFAFRGSSLPPHVCALTEILQTQSRLSTHRQPLNTSLAVAAEGSASLHRYQSVQRRWERFIGFASFNKKRVFNGQTCSLRLQILV